MVLTNTLPNGGNGTFTLQAVARSTNGKSAIIGSRTIVARNATSAFPFGTIDTPGQGATVSGLVTNFGWALTPQPKAIPLTDQPLMSILTGIRSRYPLYNHYRVDIATLFPNLANSNGAVGFFQFDPQRSRTAFTRFRWVVRDDSGATQGVGSRFFRVKNP